MAGLENSSAEHSVNVIRKDNSEDTSNDKQTKCIVVVAHTDELPGVAERDVHSNEQQFLDGTEDTFGQPVFTVATQENYQTA